MKKRFLPKTTKGIHESVRPGFRKNFYNRGVRQPKKKKEKRKGTGKKRNYERRKLVPAFVVRPKTKKKERKQTEKQKDPNRSTK